MRQKQTKIPIELNRRINLVLENENNLVFIPESEFNLARILYVNVKTGFNFTIEEQKSDIEDYVYYYSYFPKSVTENERIRVRGNIGKLESDLKKWIVLVLDYERVSLSNKKFSEEQVKRILIDLKNIEILVQKKDNRGNLDLLKAIENIKTFLSQDRSIMVLKKQWFELLLKIEEKFPDILNELKQEGKSKMFSEIVDTIIKWIKES